MVGWVDVNGVGRKERRNSQEFYNSTLVWRECLYIHAGTFKGYMSASSG